MSSTSAREKNIKKALDLQCTGGIFWGQTFQAQIIHSSITLPFTQYKTIVPTVPTVKMRFSFAVITAALLATAVALPTQGAKKPTGTFSIDIRSTLSHLMRLLVPNNRLIGDRDLQSAPMAVFQNLPRSVPSSAKMGARLASSHVCQYHRDVLKQLLDGLFKMSCSKW